MKKKRRSGPGRPEGESFARARILNAAEATFADHGYAGTSFRQIVDRANVTQALVTYYFGSKEALFKEVFLRRGREIALKRQEALKALRASRKGLALRDVVACYIRPALELRRTREGRSFIRLQARTPSPRASPSGCVARSTTIPRATSTLRSGRPRRICPRARPTGA